MVNADSTVDRLAADASAPSIEGPVRTCVGCRTRDAAAGLLRVTAVRADVASGAVPVRIAPDPGRREPGRGAWLHVNQACVDAAVRRRAFGRALRVAVATDPSLVGEYVAQHASPEHPPAQHPRSTRPNRESKAEMNP